MGLAGAAAKEAAQKAAKEAAQKAAKEAAQKASKEAAQKAAKEAAQKAAKEAAVKGAKEAAQKGAKEAAQKAAKEAAQKGSKEAAQKAAKEAAQKASKEAAQKGGKKISKKAALAVGVGVAGGAYIVYDAKKQTDKINNAVLTIKKIEKSPDNPGNIRITYDPPLLLSEDDTAKFSGTNSMPNLSPVLVDITSVIGPDTVEIKGTLTSAGTTGIMNPKTTLANQTKLSAKQKAAAAVDAAAGAAGGVIGAAVSFIEKMLGLPPGTLKKIGYGILALIILYVVYRVYIMLSTIFGRQKSGFGRQKFRGGKFSFGKLFGFGKRR
jgi:hypothetical protein